MGFDFVQIKVQRNISFELQFEKQSVISQMRNLYA